MNDLLPEKSRVWRNLEKKIATVFSNYGFDEIRTPILERTELFLRGLGEVTDIVEKEMYSFEDRLNGKTYSLRPENTAAVVRASVQHSLTYNEPRKLWYYGPMFRHERPQAGRYRQFFQFGVEMLGYDSFESEVELILMCNAVWRSIGLDGNLRPKLKLNSIGTSEERSSYVQALGEFFQKHVGILDNENLKRLKRNPLRILDSKNDNLVKLKNEAPKITAFLGNASKAHFENLLSVLDGHQISYEVDLKLVRGLDYYNSTVFEWKVSGFGAQDTVCGGGRYDALVPLLGGSPTGACGFAIGMERLVEIFEANSREQEETLVDLYFAHTGRDAKVIAIKLAEKVRKAGISVKVDLTDASLKTQVKRAFRNSAEFLAIFGEEELKTGNVSVRWLSREEGEDHQRKVPYAEMVEFLRKIKNKSGNGSQ